LVEHIASMGWIINFYKNLVGKPYGRKSCRRWLWSWMDNIKN